MPEHEINFLTVEKALSSRPSVFTPKQIEALQLRYGLTGGPPLSTPTIARRIGCTRDRAHQLITSGETTVKLVLQWMDEQKPL